MKLKLTSVQKFRTLHIITHSLAIVGLIWLWHTQSILWALVSLFAFLYAGIMGVNIALHRYYSHRSFRTSKFRDWLLLLSSFIPMLGSPAAWCSVHVYHHRTSDGPLDPHSPKNAGLLGAWFTLWPPIKMPISIYRRFVSESKMRFLHRHYFKLAYLYAGALALIDWKLAVFVWAIPAVGCFHGAAAIAVIPHLKTPLSYRNHSTRDNSRNSVVAWIMSLGEGWHNNHHAYPGRYRQGERWWEIDPSAWIIKHLLMTRK